MPEPIGTICLCEAERLMAPAGLSSEPTTSTLGAVVAMYSRKIRSCSSAAISAVAPRNVGSSEKAISNLEVTWRGVGMKSCAEGST